MTPDEAKLMALEAANDIRNMALEEAARVADECICERDCCGPKLAAAIRELKK
jgi:hypothetical protein